MRIFASENFKNLPIYRNNYAYRYHHRCARDVARLYEPLHPWSRPEEGTCGDSRSQPPRLHEGQAPPCGRLSLWRICGHGDAMPTH